MVRYLLRRIAGSIPLVLGVLTLAFVLVESVPGRASDLLIGDRPMPPEVRARIEAAYGLDRSPAERYVRWLAALVFRGELGWSTLRSRPVSEAIRSTLPATLPLAGSALLVQAMGGLALGWIAARRAGGVLDRSLDIAGLVIYATPPFWLGLMALLLLAYLVPIFPPGAMRSVGAEAWRWPRSALDLAWHVALPAAVLGLGPAVALGRFLRTGLGDAETGGVVRAARARGARRRDAIVRHGLRQALPPAVTLVGLSLPVLVSGALAVEIVFAWPGMGRLAFDAVLARDMPVVLACTLLATVMVIVGGILTDLAIAAIDPRVRLGSGSRRR